MAFLKEVGCEGQYLILKSDQEGAIKALIDDIVRWRCKAKTIVEQSPVKSSQSNGIAERAIKSIVAQVKVVKSALETRWGVEIPDAHPVMVWVTEYVGFLLNRFEVSHDGKTAYERLKGKIISWCSNKTEQDNGGPRPMDIGNVQQQQQCMECNAEDSDWPNYETNAVEAQSKCYGCGGFGHYSKNCPKGGGGGK